MGEFQVHQIRFFGYEPSAIHCMAYDETQQKLAVSRSDGSIEIWSIKDDWYQERLFAGSENQSVEAMVWCEGRLFSAGLTGCLVEHNMLTCSTKYSEPCYNGAIWCLAINEKTKQIAAGTEDGCVVLFSVSPDGVHYERALDKQEGRILSVAWHLEDNLLVTGGVDNIRVWSASSGHAIQRLTLGRQERNKETIVWAVAVTSDFTIISGDSRGKTCFWNGRQGTCIKSIQSHKADVLTLAVNKEGSCVFSSGIDPTLTQFEYTTSQPSSDWKMWVRSSVRSQHTHDVRAIAVIADSVVSGGVDCQLIFNHLEAKKGIKTWRRISPVPHTSIPLVVMARKRNIAMFRYHDYLEVWKLGTTNRTSDQNGEILALKTSPMKLLQLKAKGDETIVSGSISENADRIGYSDQYHLRIFNLNVDMTSTSPSVTLKRISPMPADVLPARCMAFTPDGRTLVTATTEGSVQVISVEEQGAELIQVFPAKTEPACGIHLLTVHPNGQLFAVGDHNHDVHVYDMKKEKLLCSLPSYPRQPTALGFSPGSKHLVVAYSDQKILEYDYSEREYTDWSRQLSRSWHPQWLKRHSKMTQIGYHPRQPHLILARDEQMFCIINKKQPFPSSSEKLYDKGMWQAGGEKQQVNHSFHICSKFKYLLHLDVMCDDILAVIERTPLAIMETFPAALQEKKFGT